MKAAFLTIFLIGCSALADNHVTPDMSTPVPWDGHCLGRPGDEGQMLWWTGYLRPTDWPLGTRYVCKDHGPDHDGWWFEAEGKVNR